jgi:heme exporter protein B
VSGASALAAPAALLRRDLLVAWRRRAEALNPLLFAVMVTALFPLALGPEANQLARIAGGVAWVTVLLASLLSLDALFRSDLEDGSLDQWLASGQSLPLLAAARLLAHWLTTGLPLTLAAPLLASMLGLPGEATWTLLAALALGTPVVSMIGGTCAALTAAMPRAGILLAVMVLPLMVPVLVFGAGAVEAGLTSVSPLPALLWLGAGLALCLPLAPIACAAAIRISAQ